MLSNEVTLKKEGKLSRLTNKTFNFDSSLHAGKHNINIKLNINIIYKFSFKSFNFFIIEK